MVCVFAAAAAAAAAEKPWLILSISVNIDWLCCGGGVLRWRMESGEWGKTQHRGKETGKNEKILSEWR